jgi:hypothetical protein
MFACATLSVVVVHHQTPGLVSALEPLGHSGDSVLVGGITWLMSPIERHIYVPSLVVHSLRHGKFYLSAVGTERTVMTKIGPKSVSEAQQQQRATHAGFPRYFPNAPCTSAKGPTPITCLSIVSFPT